MKDYVYVLIKFYKIYIFIFYIYKYNMVYKILIYSWSINSRGSILNKNKNWCTKWDFIIHIYNLNSHSTQDEVR